MMNIINLTKAKIASQIFLNLYGFNSDAMFYLYILDWHK